jgi:CDP-glucose 4,6-dehydratase
VVASGDRAVAIGEVGDRFRGRTVLVTGHTGFKGSWLSLWLQRLGARIYGLSLPPPTSPSHFEVASIGSLFEESAIGDVCDLGLVESSVERARPDIVFHLAAQPLVVESYREPVLTFATNVMGTTMVLEAVRKRSPKTPVLVITSDKCYEEQALGRGYREDDRLGGHDPYSASKAAAEIVAASYRRSFGLRIATARAGNVIGGGDWARDRIVVDVMHSLQNGDPIPVRNPSATRPFQHVLEPLSGYLRLASALMDDARFASGWNFGPPAGSETSVRELVEAMIRIYGSGSWVDRSDPSAVHEAPRLTLDATRARELGWSPRWNLEETLDRTIGWYRACKRGAPMRERSLADIAAYGEP